MIAFILGAVLVQTPVSPVGRMPETAPPIPPGAAVIRNSGSTNTAGYTVIVSPDGTAMVRQYWGLVQKVVAAPQTRWLFSKLHEAGPLDTVGGTHCMKSASFGTSTSISWNERTSGDLSCGGSAASRELLRTIGVIVRQLDIGTAPRARRLRNL